MKPKFSKGTLRAIAFFSRWFRNPRAGNVTTQRSSASSVRDDRNDRGPIRNSQSICQVCILCIAILKNWHFSTETAEAHFSHLDRPIAINQRRDFASAVLFAWTQRRQNARKKNCDLEGFAESRQ